MSTKKHGGKYLYDKVVYTGNKDKVIIGCPLHSYFEQYGGSHLRGNGCRKCFNLRISERFSSNLEEFKVEANKVHNGKYTYHNTIYTGGKNKILVTCPSHGDVLVAAYHHLRGHGCKKCANIITGNFVLLTLEEFIEKANKVHNGKYTYEKSIYINRDINLEITCPLHGSFWTNPGNHIHSASGCPRRNDSRGELTIAKTLDDIITDTKFTYEKQYRTSKCRYKNTLHFDFVIKEHKTIIGLIEYQGKQHYEPFMFWANSDQEAAKNLAAVQHRDSIKENYARTNNIPLLVIPYWDFNNIETIVKDFISNL